MKTLYYYERPDGSMDGPVEFAVLLRECTDGSLADTTRVSRGGDDDWVSLAEARARETGKPDGEPEMVATPAEVQTVSDDDVWPTPSVNGIFRFFGWAMVMVGVAGATIGALYASAEHGAAVAVSTFAVCVGVAVSGVLFLALAKGLDLLGGIYEELRNR